MASSLSEPMKRPRRQLVVYASVIFLSSASLMALEIAAARLLAPYIGASLYSWTAIIGVILGGLSLGNWLGGVWADRGGNEAALGWSLGVAALSCIAILWLLTLVAPWLQNSEMGLLEISFLFVAILFFLPAILLGVVTPLLITLALKTDERTGHIVGMMHALAAFGSIAGTFVTGYVLIQYVGTQAVVLGIAGLLALQSLWFLWRSWKSVASLAVMAVMISSAAVSRDGMQSFCDRETSYFCIQVVDLSEQVPFGEVRGMVLDHLLHGMNHQQYPEVLLSPYVHLMDEMITLQAESVTERPLRSFFAGGGAYTQPRALRERYPEAEIVIAELDPAVTEVAREQLYYEGVADTVIHSDARRVLGQMPAAYYDVIVGDVFHDIAIPYHLVTREYAQLVQSRLQEEGLYVLNAVDAHPDPRLVKSIVKTLREVFPDVRVWLESWPQEPERMTYVVVAGGKGMPVKRYSSRSGIRRDWLEVTGFLEKVGTPYHALPVLKDNFAPVERLLSSLLFGELGR